MRERLKRGRILKKIRHFHNEKKLQSNQYLYVYAILIGLVLLLCACQKSPQVTVYVKPSSLQNTTDKLKVENGDYQETLKLCEERLSQIQEDSLEAADVYSIMGGIYAEYLGERNKAVEYISKAIDIHQRENDDLGLAKDYKNMSDIYIYIGGDAQEGIEYLDKAEQLYNKNGVVEDLAFAGVLIRKGQIYQNEAQYEDALKAFKKAQDIYEKRQEVNISLHVLTGQVYLEMLEYELAEKEYLEAQKICEDEGNQYSLAVVEFQLGWLYRKMNEYSRAIEHYNKALNFYQRDEIYLYKVAKTYNNISYAHDQLGELEKALEYSVYSCRTIENVKTVTSDVTESKQINKHNLKQYYMEWSKDESEEGFEAWYQKVVLEGKDWKE